MGDYNVAFGEVQLERPNWFGGRLLTAADLDLQQTYVRERARRHNRLLHGWGVVTGLCVTAERGLALTIGAGFAIDAAGNEIVVPDSGSLDATAAGVTTAGCTYWLAVRWDESPAGEVPAPRPNEPPVAAAWREDFEIAILDAIPEDGPAAGSRAATPWVLLATVLWDGGIALTVDTSVQRPLSLPTSP